MLPAARLTDLTVTGDLISGPGIPNVLIGNMPAAVLGDMVSGSVCVGTLMGGCSMSVLIGNRPAARMTTMASGANPVTGIPVTTAVGPPACPTVLIGG